MNGFFDTPEVGTQDLAWAERLRLVLTQARRADKVKVSGWANEFRLLRRNHPDEEIEGVLTWFELNVTDKYTPVIYSAAGFRRKFAQLVDASNRGTKRTAEITDLARRIQRDLGDLIWPGDEKKDELTAIQLSVDAYTEFLVKLRGGQTGLARYLYETVPAISVFMEGWFVQIHRMAWEWDEWQGNLLGSVVSTESKRFRRIVNNWCGEYLGGGEHWGRVEELLQ